jgi:hypothetical protein
MPSTHFLTTEGFAMFKILITALVISLGSAATLVAAQTAAPIRLRATVEKVEPGSITVKERSGEVVVLQLASNLVMTEVFPIDIADIKAGSYIGTAAMPQADGTLKALEVLVFPEAMRGVGEGHRPFDLQPQSTMTNATVDQLVASSDGKTLKLKYKDGEKTLTIAAGAPIVTFKPGDNSLLVVGAKLIVTAELRDGKPTALRIVAGKNGFAPPM